MANSDPIRVPWGNVDPMTGEWVYLDPTTGGWVDVDPLAPPNSRRSTKKKLTVEQLTLLSVLASQPTDWVYAEEYGPLVWTDPEDHVPSMAERHGWKEVQGAVRKFLERFRKAIGDTKKTCIESDRVKNSASCVRYMPPKGGPGDDATLLDRARRLAAITWLIGKHGTRSQADIETDAFGSDADLLEWVEKTYSSVKSFLDAVKKSKPGPSPQRREVEEPLVAATLEELVRLGIATSSSDGEAWSKKHDPLLLKDALHSARDQPKRWAGPLALAHDHLACEGGEGDPAEGLLRRLWPEQDRAAGANELLLRIVARAEMVPRETVQAALGMPTERWAWNSRRTVLNKTLGERVKDPRLRLDLVHRFARSTSNGNDLWFARQWFRGFAKRSRAKTNVPSERARLVLEEHAADQRRRTLEALSGNAEPPSEDYWLSQLVTNAQYERFDAGHSEDRPPEESGSDPVVNVTWWEAKAFAKWVGGRLPTWVQLSPSPAPKEAVTETDAPTDTPDHGDADTPDHDADDPPDQEPSPVGEWTDSLWAPETKKTAPPNAMRVIRGGVSTFWGSEGGAKDRTLPGSRWDLLGFRVALPLPAGEADSS